MMVRLLSILPGLMGVICAIIVIASLIGYETDWSEPSTPVVPCSEDEEVGCRVGMTGKDTDVPSAFMLLDIEMEIKWSEPDRGWIGVVGADAAKNCPRDSNGLTDCEAEDIAQFLVAGGPDRSGSLSWQVEPGGYRFVAGGHDGSGLDSQEVDVTVSVHLSDFVEIILSAAAVLLLLGAGEMAFPVRNILKRFRNE